MSLYKYSRFQVNDINNNPIKTFMWLSSLLSALIIQLLMSDLTNTHKYVHPFKWVILTIVWIRG